MSVTKEQLKAVKGKKPDPPTPRRPTPKKKGQRPVKKKKPRASKIDRRMFAKALISNSMNATAAYKEVSPNVTQKTASANGSRMLSDARTINILTPMLQKLFIDAGIEADYVFKRWLEMAEGSAADYFTFKHGAPILDMSDMTEAQRKNLKKITVTPGQYGTKYSIEIHDAQNAVNMIAKHLGLLIDRLADEDVDKIGDLIEQGVARIKKNMDLDAWKSITFEVEDRV